MAIIVNNPAGEESGLSFTIGLILLIVVVALFAIFVWPGLRQDTTPAAQTPNTTNLQVEVPSPLPVDSNSTSNNSSNSY